MIDSGLPQVAKGREIFSAAIRLKWPEQFLTQAENEARSRSDTHVRLFFVAKVIGWNPKGRRFYGHKHVANLAINFGRQGSVYEAFSERAFPLHRWKSPKEKK